MRICFGIFLAFSIQAMSYGFPDPDSRGGGRIVGGIAIPMSQAPYQVSLEFRGSHTCGGSIISRNFVLTACHCTYKKTARDLSVRIGTKSLGEGGEVITVLVVINHPYFKPYTYDYDFALLRLAKLITLDGITKAIIPLPTLNEPIADATDVLVSGWGSTRSMYESNQELRAVVVSTMNQEQCNKIYEYDGGITKQMVCASAPGKDSCSGDSGGPMKRVSDGVLIGLVSFGMDCADKEFPGVYSRIAPLRSWIRAYAGV